MIVWSAVLVLMSSVLAMEHFRGALPFWVESLAQLAAVLSVFVLVCALEAGGRNRHTDGANPG